MLSYKIHKQYNSGLILHSGFVIFINYLLVQVLQYFLNDKYPSTPILSYAYLLILLLIFLIIHVVKDHKQPYEDLNQLYEVIETDNIKEIIKPNSTIIYQQSDLSSEDIQEYVDFENNLVKDQIQEVQNRLTKNVSQLFDTINTNKLIIDNKNIELSQKINDYNKQSNSLDTIHEIQLNEHQEQLDELDQSIDNNTNLINEKTKSNENLINEKTQENRDLINEKTKSNENLINEKTQENTDLINQKTQSNANLINQKAQENTDLINQKTKSNENLINEKTQENRDLIDQKTKSNENLINKKTQENTTLINEKTKSNESLINQKTKSNENLINEKAQENRDLIDQKIQENKDLIYQKTQENKDLIDQKTQENKDLIDQKTQENKDLIDQKTQENRELIDANYKKIDKNESDIGQLFMKVGTNISNISSNSSNITDNQNNIQNIEDNQQDINNFINKYTSINNINKILPNNTLYYLNRNMKLCNSIDYQLNLDNLQEWKSYRYSDFIHEINDFLNIASFNSQANQTYTTLDRIYSNLMKTSKDLIKFMIINQFRSDSSLNQNAQYILDDKVYMDINKKYEAIEDLLTKIYPKNTEYTKSSRSSKRNSALHRVLFKSKDLLSVECFKDSIPLSQKKQIYLLNILYGKNIYTIDDPYTLRSIWKQMINQYDKDYASLLSGHKSKITNHIQYHVTQIQNLSLDFTKYVYSNGSQLKAINKHIKELLKTIDAIYSMAIVEKGLYYNHIYPAIERTIDEYNSFINDYNKLLEDKERNQNQIGYNAEEYNNKIQLFAETKVLYDDLIDYIYNNFIDYGQYGNTIGLECISYSPWKKVIGSSGDFNISPGLSGAYPKTNLFLAYSKLSPILENIEQLHAISKRIDMILLAMSN